MQKGKHGPGLGKLPKIWGSPSIFTRWLKLATSNLVHSLGLPRPITKSHPEENVGWPWARGTPKNFVVLYNISATAGAKDFKFGTQLGFAKAYHKTTPKGKVGVALG